MVVYFFCDYRIVDKHQIIAEQHFANNEHRVTKDILGANGVVYLFCDYRIVDKPRTIAEHNIWLTKNTMSLKMKPLETRRKYQSASSWWFTMVLEKPA